MEDTKQNKKEEGGVFVSTELSPGSGSMLAEARKKQQRTIEEMASELNLSLTQVRTIELDQSEGLPEPTYVRGYIRSYAKLLGLNPEKVLENYKNPNWQKSANLDDMPRGIGSAEMSEPDGFFSAAKVLSMLLVAGLVAFLWYSGILNNLFSDDDAVAKTEPVKSAVKETVAGKTNANTSVGQGVEQAVAATTKPVDTPADGANNSASDANGVAGNSVSNEMVLSFSATSWVDIRDAEDNRLAYKSYTRGEELIVPIESRISVFIGNAEGVNVQYNGEAYDISGFREGVYAKFVME